MSWIYEEYDFVLHDILLSKEGNMAQWVHS